MDFSASNLIIGNSRDESLAVQVKVDINEVRQEPLGVPAVLLRVLDFQVPEKKTIQLNNFVPPSLTYLHLGPLVSWSRTWSSIAASLSASSGLRKGWLMSWVR